MCARKTDQIVNVEIEWTLNYDPTPIEKKRWRKFWQTLFIEALNKTESNKEAVNHQPASKKRETIKVNSKTRFRCSRCGQTWPEKRTPEENLDPEWWKCPNGCYKKRNMDNKGGEKIEHEPTQ